jgi:molecular chaperone Hsp33
MNDTVQHVMTPDGSIRAVTIDARQTVAQIIEAQEPGDLSEALGELLMGATLVRSTMDPDHRLQMTLKYPNVSIYADALPLGKARGWVAARENPLSKPQFQVARVLESGQVHEGTIEAGASISETLTTYMMSSEQTTSTVGVSCSIVDGRVEWARGFIVQLLPNPSAEALEAVTFALENLQADWPRLDDTFLGLAILGDAFRLLSSEELSFGCTCSESSVERAMVAAGKKEVDDMLQAGQPVEVVCEFCRTKYVVSIEDLRKVFNSF